MRKDVAKAVWLGGDKKGAYTRLENPFASALKNLGFESEEVAESEDHIGAPSAGLDFSFDFCEICGGSGVVSKEAARLGMTVCPPIELSSSEHYDISNTKLIEWLCFMITSGKIRSCIFEPPSTSFSPAAHPAVRSYSHPIGVQQDVLEDLVRQPTCLPVLHTDAGGLACWSSFHLRAAFSVQNGMVDYLVLHEEDRLSGDSHRIMRFWVTAFEEIQTASLQAQSRDAIRWLPWGSPPHQDRG